MKNLIILILLTFSVSVFASDEGDSGPLCDILPELHYCNPPPPPSCEPWPECGIIDPLFAKGKTIGRPKSKKQQCLDAGYKWDSETQTCKGVPPSRMRVATKTIKPQQPKPCKEGWKWDKMLGCIPKDARSV